MKMNKTVGMTVTAIIVAFMLVMNFTPLGYIVSPAGFSITLMIIPVAVGAAVLGPSCGTLLGFVFGLTSFLQCFGIGYFIDPSAALLFNTSPVGTVITCFVPRMLMGLLVGLIFRALSRFERFRIGSFAVASFSAPVLNTLLFITSYIIFFRNTILAGTAIKTVIISILSINGLIEIIVSMVLGTALCQAFYMAVKKIH